MWFRAFILSLLPVSVAGQGIINTFAGTDWLFPRTDGAAIDAPLGFVAGVALDASGNVYLSDTQNQVVCVLRPDGKLSVVAGNGLRGFSGDGGLALDASLDTPQALALDSTGNLFIADNGNARIRKLAPNGIITTLDAFSGQARALAFGVGGLYIADDSANMIRRLNPDGSIVSIAGNGTRGFTRDGLTALFSPITLSGGVAVNRQGEVFFGDGAAVRRILLNGKLETVIGFDGTGQLQTSICEPAGLVFDNRDTLYIADRARDCNQILRFTADRQLSVLAGSKSFGFSGDGALAGNASFRYPTALAVDAQRSVYITDSGNQRLRLVDSSGLIRTVAGNGRFRTTNDRSPALQSFLFSPAGLAFGPDRALYIADESAQRVRRVDLLSGTFTTIAGGGFATNGNVRALDAFLNHPTSLGFGPDGNLFLADMAEHRVWKINPAGTILPFAGDGTPGFFGDESPEGLPTKMNLPTGLAVHPTGVIYVADRGNHRIRLINANGTMRSVAGTGTPGDNGDVGPSQDTQLNNPYSVAFEPQGNLLICDSGNNKIRRRSPDGILRTIAGTGRAASDGDGGPALSASLNFPTALAFDSQGAIYVLETGGGRIRRIDPAPPFLITTVAGNAAVGFGGDGGLSTAALLNTPRLGLLVDADKVIYFSDTLNDRIRQIQFPHPTLSVTPDSLRFDAGSGQSAFRQSIRISTDTPGLLVTVTPRALSGGSWLSVDQQTATLSRSAPRDIQVSVDASGLAPGVYRGTVSINAPLIAQPFMVNVVLDVSGSSPPRLSVNKPALSFTLPPNGPSAQDTLIVANTGGGSASFSVHATTAAGGDWLAVSPASGISTSTDSATLTVTANASALSLGTYSGMIVISGPAGSLGVPVSITINEVKPKILISQTGLTFSAVSLGGSPPPQQFGILNVGEGALNWSARAVTLSGGDWLRLSARSGRVATPFLDVSLVDVSVDPSGLAPGDYYGRLEITAPADNSPQLATVILKVLPQDLYPGPDVRPTGLIFTGVQGANPSSQEILITNLLSQRVRFASARLTFDGGNWFAHSPATGDVLPNTPGRLVVQPTFTSLSPDVRRGVLTIQFEDGTVRTVSVLSVVAPRPSPSPAKGDPSRSAASCSPRLLQVQFTSLRDGFLALAGRPTTIQVKVVDDCGQPLTPDPAPRVEVFSVFSNRDPDLSLTHIGNGSWVGTWRPLTSAPATSVSVTAFYNGRDGIRLGRATLSGIVSPSDTPLVPPGALRHSASFATDVPVAPGSLISLLGSNLAVTEASLPSLPLPSNLADTQVTIGNRPLPLLYVSPSQVNAQIPYDLPVNLRLQVLVARGSTQSVPEPFTVAPTQPGIFTKNQQGFGQALAVKASDRQTLAEPGSPAEKGETLVLFCSGLGAVAAPVESGVAAPDPPAPTLLPVRLRIGDRDLDASFSGLSPGLSGLYEVSFQVPSDAPSGNQVPITITVGTAVSQTATIAIR